ncbi:MAG: GNAT family N-acetyltransferase [Chloroflexota bacterium]|nr:GNAT family N-acetyltransferase [Chloroflexota bacterium]
MGHDMGDETRVEPVGDAGAETGAGELVRAGERVTLRRHVPANREAFQRWYADDEIARLLRHDLAPLTERQSRGYFDTLILPLSARGMCWALHETGSGQLVGSAAITDVIWTTGSGLYRIVIGEKDRWGKGYGTEATRLVLREAWSSLGLRQVRLEVFGHNERAIASYRRVGFRQVGAHQEWVTRQRVHIDVREMVIDLGSDSEIGHRQPDAPGDAPADR